MRFRSLKIQAYYDFTNVLKSYCATYIVLIIVDFEEKNKQFPHMRFYATFSMIVISERSFGQVKNKLFYNYV